MLHWMLLGLGGFRSVATAAKQLGFGRDIFRTDVQNRLVHRGRELSADI